jgi:hypothetical protein
MLAFFQSPQLEPVAVAAREAQFQPPQIELRPGLIEYQQEMAGLYSLEEVE